MIDRFAIALIIGLALPACTSMPTPQASRAHTLPIIIPTETPTTDRIPTPTQLASPEQPIAISGQAYREYLSEQLALYGVTIVDSREPTIPNMLPIYEAVYKYGDSVFGLAQPDKFNPSSRRGAFSEVFGPCVFRVRQGYDTLDGMHYAMNCGWEGRQAEACQDTTVYPEQEFPQDAWLILIAGKALLRSGRDEGVRLVAHELAHNLTWGEGHNPANIGGFSYVLYVSDRFALDHSQAFGVQAGFYTYETEAVRLSHPFWRLEINADAIASWGLNDLIGPYASLVRDELNDFMYCEINNEPGC